MRTSEETKTLFEALEKAQAAIEPVAKDGKAHYGKFATLGAVKEASRQALVDNTLILIQMPTQAGLCTRLYHKGGQWLEGEIPWAKSDSAQDLAIDITYFRRYARTTILDMETVDSDGDKSANRQQTPNNVPQNASSPQTTPSNPSARPSEPKRQYSRHVPNEPPSDEKPERSKYDWSQGGEPPKWNDKDNPPTENQIKRLFTIANHKGLSEDDVHEMTRLWLNVTSTHEMTWKQYSWFCNAIEDGLTPPVDDPDEEPF